MVTASFPLCLTQGVHPIYSRSFAFIRGPIVFFVSQDKTIGPRMNANERE